MSMSVSGADSSAAMAAWQSRRQDLGSLFSAVKSGDLNSAEQAFSALTGQSSTTSTSASVAGATATVSPQNGPLAAIGQALASGDISAAQKALAAAFSGVTGGHHHHHHSNASGSNATTAATTPTLPAGTTISAMA